MCRCRASFKFLSALVNGGAFSGIRVVLHPVKTSSITQVSRIRH